jgi:hypothetical protein
MFAYASVSCVGVKKRDDQVALSYCSGKELVDSRTLITQLGR